jgi:hypothetical protein
MDYNSLIEIGSKANIILRFKSEANINGFTYAANEPYLFLKNVNVIINYSNQSKSGETDINVIANSDIKPRTVVVGGFSFSRKIASLLASFNQSNLTYQTTLFRSITAIKQEEESFGRILLLDEIKIDDNLFVYDSDFNRISVTYDVALNSLNSEDLIEDEEYLVSFSSDKTGTKFDLNKTHVPYMSLEIQGIGNINKTKKEVLMYFDKVSLNSMINFTFIQDEMINVPLQFLIIDDKNNYVIFED